VNRLIDKFKTKVKQKTQEDKKMNNIIIATFTSDKAAIDGVHKLNDLDWRGDIVVYNNVLLRRNLDGTFSYLKDERDISGWKTMGGMLLGTAVGVLGGPVGALAGMITGLTIGGFADVAQYGFDYDFLESFKDGLPVGTTSLIMQVSEPSEVFINSALEPLGATISRSNVYAEQDRYVQTQLDALDAGIDEAELQLREAAAENKAAIQARLTELRTKRQAKVAEIKADFQEDVETVKADITRIKQTLQGKVDNTRKRILEKRLANDEAIAKKFEAQAQKLNTELSKYSRPAAV
jgi:uncharacterized membrane protein